MSTVQISTACLAMPMTCVNPEKTMEFINLIYNDEYVRNTIAYGIEGKHWVADGEDHYALPEFINRIKSVGVDEIIAGAQRQYDEWRKNK